MRDLIERLDKVTRDLVNEWGTDSYRIRCELYDIAKELESMQRAHEKELIEFAQYKDAAELAMQRIRLFYRWLQRNHYIWVKEDVWVGETAKGETEAKLFQIWEEQLDKPQS